MRRNLTALSVAAVFLFFSGCQVLDPVARKVNSPDKQFEATYQLSERSLQLGGPSKVETIKLILKRHKFYAAYYTGSRLTKKIIYDGKTLWQFLPKEYKRDKDTAIYKKASPGSLGGVYFWRMPPRELPKPTKQTIDARPHYVYEYNDFGPSGHVEVAIFVDAEDFVITRITSGFFLRSGGPTPFIEWEFECKEMVFRDDIPDSTFEFEPPAGAKVLSFQEAVREGMEAFKELFSGAI